MKERPGQRDGTSPRKQPIRKKIGLSPTSTRVLFGKEDLSKWDEEELERGRRRALDGTFRGPPAKVVPVACHTELSRRKFEDAGRILKRSLKDGAEALRKIIVSETTSDSDRLKAIELLFDRVLGKAPQHVSLDVGSDSEPTPWMKLVAQAVVGSVEQAKALMAENVIDGEVVEEQ
jgi:hypothetical protein